MPNERNIITPQEKEELFLQFTHSYVTFLIYICKEITCGGKGVRQALENSIINSLTLMWQLHTAASTLKMSYKRAGHAHGTGLTFNQEQAQFVVLKLKELRVLIKHDQTIERSSQRYCLSMIDQIGCYYEENNVVIVAPNLHADPWLAHAVKQGCQELRRCNDKND